MNEMFWIGLAIWLFGAIFGFVQIARKASMILPVTFVLIGMVIACVGTVLDDDDEEPLPPTDTVVVDERYVNILTDVFLCLTTEGCEVHVNYSER